MIANTGRADKKFIFGWVMYDPCGRLPKIHKRRESCLYWVYREVRGKKEIAIIC
jgi:hypothetical protein